MSNAILDQMRIRIASGLQRKSVTSCSRWAEAFRVMKDPFPGKWTFNHHPWLREMHDSTAEMNVGQKAAQMGYTEWALNTAFYNIDVKGVDVLYVLPAKTPDASDFSAARFDPALEMSPHLSGLFSDVKNIGHKRAGTANLYIRGSKSRAGLKSVPVGIIILDEVNEMPEENISLALERTSGQREHQDLLLSTPTLPGAGINKYFRDSTQEKFHFKCPGCSKWTELTFPECLEITAEDIADPKIKDSFLKCRECGVKLPHETKVKWLSNGKWIPTHSQRSIRGFHVSQLYSCLISPAKLAIAYLRSLRDQTDEQEFYNSKLGKEHTVSGAQLNDENINNAIRNYRNGREAGRGLLTMGVDVGRWLHYWIDSWTLGQVIGVDVNSDAVAKTIEVGKVESFEELNQKMIQWSIHACVIDRHPETRAALQFANRFFGFVRLCMYGQGINGKDIHASKDEEHTVLVDRTSWLDLSLGRFRRSGAITIPMDFPIEARQQLKAPIRVYKRDKDGNNVGRYESGSEEDHFAHARNYSEIALSFAASRGQNFNISSPV